MPKIHGVLETAIYVADLESAVSWYEKVFGFKKLLHNDRMCALHTGERSIFLIFKMGGTTEGEELPGGTIPPHDASGCIHFALAIDINDLEEWEEHLTASGVAVESRVHAERGGRSLYFRDPDGHLVELATPGLWQVY